MNLIRMGLAGLMVLSLSAQDKAKIELGRYLVEEVGKCQEGHTAKLDSGELDRTKWLEGAVLDFAPIKPVAGWHKTSPGLTPEILAYLKSLKK